LPNSAPKSKDGEELHDEARGPAHEGLGPVGQQRLARERRGEQRRERREEQHAPAPVGEEDEERKTEQDADETHGF
jgi:hypothetical protein